MLGNITNLLARLTPRRELNDSSSDDTDDSAADDEIIQGATEEILADDEIDKTAVKALSHVPVRYKTVCSYFLSVPGYKSRT